MALTVVLAGSAVAAPCPRNDAPTIHDSDTVRPGGGVIVEQRSDTRATDVLRFRDGATEIVPAVRIVAPGLEVYEVPAGTSDLDLIAAGTQIGRLHRAASAPLLPAPKATRLVWEDDGDPTTTSEMESYGNLGPRTATATAFLADGVPEDAFALVIARVDRHGSVVPAAWGLALAGSDQVYAVTRSCRTAAPFVHPGERVVLAWLDRAGRLSPTSKPVLVTR